MKKALFLGNSYTYFNEMPTLVAQIASSLGDSLFKAQYCPGGYTLEMHSQDPTTRSAIAAGAWDYVILQEQSQLPSLWPDSVALWTYPFADTLNRLIKTNDSCTTTMFFMTWGRKNGDSQFCPVYPPVCTYLGMQARLRESYLAMGQMLDAEVSPVGVSWKQTRSLMPSLDLYLSDESHPSLSGSYLAACTFYAAIFHKSPSGAFVPPGIPAGTADSLQYIASHMVLDSLQTWNIDTSQVRAGFDYLPQSAYCFQFMNQSQNALQYRWDFGDGSHSSAVNPQHCYSSPGMFTVKLFSSNVCKTDSISKTVLVNPASVPEMTEHKLLIRPNPSEGRFFLEISGTMTLHPGQASIYSFQGQKVAVCMPDREQMIDLSFLDDGLYFLVLDSGRERFTARFAIRH